MKANIKHQIAIVLGVLALAVMIRSELPAQELQTGREPEGVDFYIRGNGEIILAIKPAWRWFIVYSDARGVLIEAGAKQYFFNAASAGDIAALVRLHNAQVRAAR